MYVSGQYNNSLKKKLEHERQTSKAEALAFISVPPLWSTLKGHKIAGEANEAKHDKGLAAHKIRNTSMDVAELWTQSKKLSAAAAGYLFNNTRRAAYPNIKKVALSHAQKLAEERWEIH